MRNYYITKQNSAIFSTSVLMTGDIINISSGN